MYAFKWGFDPSTEGARGWRLCFVLNRGKLPGVQAPDGSQQYGVYVSRLVEKNYKGYKRLSDEGRKDNAHTSMQ